MYKIERHIFLEALLIVFVVMVAFQGMFHDSMVIYTKNAKPNEMQVFFPDAGGYSEKDSTRPAIKQGEEGRAKFFLKWGFYDHIRIDPANNRTELEITKIEINRLLGVDIVSPQALVGRIKPIQMIGSIEVVSGGVQITTTGNDPAFEFDLSAPIYKSSVVVMFVVFLIILCVSYGAIVFLRKHVGAETAKNISLVSIPLLATLFIVGIFYPGFMSYDTLHALRSAKGEVADSMWPPMVSYVWRLVGFISYNPSVMHFLQVFILLGALYYVLQSRLGNKKTSSVLLAVYLSVPVILGTLAVIWKDVLMASMFMAALALIVVVEKTNNKTKIIFLSLMAYVFIFIAVCTRHNAITAALPLVVFLAYVCCSKWQSSSLWMWAKVGAISVVLTGTAFALKVQLDHYSLPGFQKIGGSTEFFLRSVRALDVAGASLCAKESLFGDAAPTLSVADIAHLYDPRHINLSQGLLQKVALDERIDKAWLAVARHHPLCFFENKILLTKYMIGANQGEQFLITHPYVDANEFGYVLPYSPPRDLVVGYISGASHLFVFKPWFIYIMAIALFLARLKSRSVTAIEITVMCSGTLYFLGLVGFGNAADARLLFYTTTSILLYAALAYGYKNTKEDF